MSRAPVRLAVRLHNAAPAAWPRLPRARLLAVLRDAHARHAPRPLPADVRKRGATLDILFADDAEIARLHETFGRGTGPTDVLSFSDGTVDPRTGRTHLGDVAVGAETALREAVSRGRRPADELILYALHGLLHLCGFEDGDDDARAAMFRAQAAILRRHGLAADDAP